MHGKRLNIVPSALLLLVPLAAPAIGPDSHTTGTLALGDVFDSRPGTAQFQMAPAVPDPAGTVLLIPDTAAWRVPAPTPTPVPTPRPFDIPAVEAIVLRLSDRLTVTRNVPGLQSRGQQMQGVGFDNAEIVLQTPYTRLRTEYRIIPAGGGEPFIILHGPGARETIQIPAGRYTFQRRVWRIEEPKVVYTETWREQVLQGATRWEFTADSSGEQPLTTLLRETKSDSRK